MVRLFSLGMMLLCGCSNRVWVTDSRECYEKCVLAGAPSKYPQWATYDCVRAICAGHWEEK